MMGLRRMAGVEGLLDIEPPPYRDYLLQPYRETSIWNTPVGDAADEQPGDLTQLLNGSGKISADPIRLCMSASDEVHSLSNGTTVDSGTKSPAGATAEIGYPSESTPTCHIPDSMTHNSGWNGIVGLLNAEDTTKAWTGQPLYRPNSSTDPQFYYAGSGYPTGVRGLDDLLGDGRKGAHGGGQCGGIGGCLRTWEYDAAVAGNDEAINHRLALNVYSPANLSQHNQGLGSGLSGAGWRWPAYKADSNFTTPGANNYYGRNGTGYDGVVMGSLMALPLGYDLSGISDPLVAALGWTLLNFGAQIVDVVGLSPRCAFSVEQTSESAWSARNTTTFHAALATLVGDLVLIDDCLPATPGGAGNPRTTPPLPLEPPA